MFILIAHVFDLYKWCMFIALSNHQDVEESEKREILLKRVFIGVFASFIVVSLSLIIAVIISDKEQLPSMLVA